MRHKKLKLNVMLLLGFGLTGLQAQNMYVVEKNGTQTAYSLDELEKMTFSSSYVTVHKTDNSTKAYALDRLKYLSFDEISSKSSTFTDPRDGNVYKTVTIGKQVWMAENLKYLPSVTEPRTTSNVMPLYYVYDLEGSTINAAKANDNYKTYGVLYNWPAAIKACPTGWHLPTDEDWQTLTKYLGGASYCAGDLKTTGTAENRTGLWASPNTAATNKSGFSALPGGHLYIYRDDGSYLQLGKCGYWWTATESSDQVWYRRIDYNGKKIYNNLSPKKWGYSVRCIKN